MSQWIDMLFVLVILIDLLLLASSRLNALIQAVAVQGALISLVPPLLAPWGSPAGGQPAVLHVLLLAEGALVVKGLVIPRMLSWAIREAAIRREVEPLLGFVPTLLLGAVGVALAFAGATHLPLPVASPQGYLVPTALSSVWTGLLLIVTRKKAVTQVAGFLVMENGIFLVGLLLSEVMPAMVEAGVLLDLFAAVFVMGIVMHHINREFSSLDTAKLSTLRD